MKIGNTAVAQVIDYLLRDVARINIISSGSKLNPRQIKDIIPQLISCNPDLIILTTPNPGATGPKFAREMLSEIDIPAIIIGDSPLVGNKIQNEMKNQNLGYILVSGDPMIGVRREWLDATEMCIFNANIVKVLSVCGVFKLIRRIIMESINNNFELPNHVITCDEAIREADFKNPYAMSKAIAAYTIAEEIAYINLDGSYLTNEFDRYIYLVSSAHELADAAYKLASEAYLTEHTPFSQESNDFFEMK